MSGLVAIEIDGILAKINLVSIPFLWYLWVLC